MTTEKNKVRSTVSYWHEFPDGSEIKVSAFKNGNHILWHLKGAKDMPEDQQLEIVVGKYGIDSVLNTPLGGIPTIKLLEKKEFEMSYKQYKEFITRFWENGHEYYDTI